MTRLALFAMVLASAAQARQLALVVGENRGSGPDEPLRFAQADALKVRDALVDVGGFTTAEVTVLEGASAERLRGALIAITAELRREPTERLVVYVSSHAGDGALHLAGSDFPMDELVSFMKQAPVHVGVLIVDACRSGAVTRLKGLTPSGPPTVLEATGVEGRVFISASGADEYAQESDALGGSTFTHYLLTGLRGAADRSGDGRVTLDEVYGWAWARTIEATFGSRGGVQRPNFSVDLRGQGQLVLSEPRSSRAHLRLEVKAPGHWLVVGVEKGDVVADVDKAEGPLQLALRPGTYRLRLRTGREVLERAVTVPEQGDVLVTERDLESSGFVRVARKGAEDAVFVLSASGGVASGLVAALTAQPGGELRLRRDGWLVGPLNQVALSFGVRDAFSAAASHFEQVELELRVATGHRFVFGRVSALLGLEAGPMLVLQSHLPDGTGRTSLALDVDAAVELRFALVDSLELSLLGAGGGVLAKRPQSLVFAPRAFGTLGVAYGF